MERSYDAELDKVRRSDQGKALSADTSASQLRDLWG